MKLHVELVCGPRRAGKTCVIRSLVDRACRIRPHYVRLRRRDEHPENPCLNVPDADRLFASTQLVTYDDETICEVLTDTLKNIGVKDRRATVMIEADADPAVRCAFQHYDHRVFVLPTPSAISDVFRPAHAAASALQSILADTAEFASEVFGVINREPSENGKCNGEAGLSAAQWRRFLYTPLGEELITYILLEPDFHGLVESDVVILNPALGQCTAATAPCLRKLDCLLEHINRLTHRQVRRYVWDPQKEPTEEIRQLLDTLEKMFQT